MKNQNKASMIQNKFDLDEKRADDQKDKHKLALLNNAVFWKDSTKIRILIDKKQQAVLAELRTLPRKIIQQLISLVEKVPNALVVGALLIQIKPVTGAEYYFQSGFDSRNAYLWNTTQSSSNAYDQETLQICLTRPVAAAKVLKTVMSVCKNGYIQSLQGSTGETFTDPTLECIYGRYSCGGTSNALGIVITVICLASLALFCYCCCRKRKARLGRDNQGYYVELPREYNFS